MKDEGDILGDETKVNRVLSLEKGMPAKGRTAIMVRVYTRCYYRLNLDYGFMLSVEILQCKRS